MAEDNKAIDHSTTVTAGAAGAGSGTLLVLLANNLPPDHSLRTWLIIVAPSASIAIAYLWNKATIAIESYLRKRELKALVTQAEETLNLALRNGSISPEHRMKLTERLEQLQMLLVETDVEKIKSLRAYR